MAQLADLPTVPVVILAVVIVMAIGRLLLAWRRQRALRHHAGQRGWQPLDGGGLAELATEVTPELLDLRRARTGTSIATSRGSGPPVVDIVMASVTGEHRVRARAVHLVPVRSGEVVVGEVLVNAPRGSSPITGRHSGNIRSMTMPYAVVAAQVARRLPPVRFTRRSQLEPAERDRSLPPELDDHFSVERADKRTRRAYVDSDAWRQLLEETAEVDVAAVRRQTLVVATAQPLTPERALALIDVVERFAAAASDRGSSGYPTKLANPLMGR